MLTEGLEEVWIPEGSAFTCDCWNIRTETICLDTKLVEEVAWNPLT